MHILKENLQNFSKLSQKSSCGSWLPGDSHPHIKCRIP